MNNIATYTIFLLTIAAIFTHYGKKCTASALQLSPPDDTTGAKKMTLTVKPGFKKGGLLEFEDFSGTLDNWMTEGKVDARIINDKLFFESSDLQTDNPKFNMLV